MIKETIKTSLMLIGAAAVGYAAVKAVSRAAKGITKYVAFNEMMKRCNIEQDDEGNDVYNAPDEALEDSAALISIQMIAKATANVAMKAVARTANTVTRLQLSLRRKRTVKKSL